MIYSPTTGYHPMPSNPNIRTRIWRFWCQGYDANTATIALIASSLAGLVFGSAFIISIAIHG